MGWLLLHMLLLAWLSYKAYLVYKPTPLHWYYWPAFALKITSGVGIGMLYFFYYGHGDVYNYHHDATELAALALHEPATYLASWAGEYSEGLELRYSGEERALFTAKIFSLFYVFTNSNFWLASVWISFLSFLASFQLVVRLVHFRPFLQKAAPLAFLFWPSHVVWTSGLLKESLAMGCMAFIAATTLPAILSGKKLKWMEVLLSAALFVLLFKIKYYYAGLFGPFLICLLVVSWLQRRYNWHELLACGVFILLLALGIGGASQLHPNLYPSRFLQVWVENYYLLANASAEANYVLFEGVRPAWESVLEHAPKAIFAGLLAPVLPMEPGNLLKLAAGAENTFLLLLSATGVLGWLLKPGQKISLSVLAVCVYVLVFALFIAIAAPNYGTLLRYRISYHPFYVLLVLAGVKHFIARTMQIGKSR